MEVLFKKIDKDAKVPQQATSGSAGWDFYTTRIEVDFIDDKHVYVVGYTGIAVEVPKGYFLGLFVRSGVSKKGFSLANSVGVVDSDYRGEIVFHFRGFLKEMARSCVELLHKECLNRPVQGILIPYKDMKFVEVEELSETKRGSGGFGSTGVK
jgi:dUTP pyrophosphatase